MRDNRLKSITNVVGEIPSTSSGSLHRILTTFLVSSHKLRLTKGSTTCRLMTFRPPTNVGSAWVLSLTCTSKYILPGHSSFCLCCHVCLQYELWCCKLPVWGLQHSPKGVTGGHWVCSCGQLYHWLDDDRNTVWDPLREQLIPRDFLDHLITPNSVHGWKLVGHSHASSSGHHMG